MKEYEIFLPLYYNDGQPIEPVKFRRVQQKLLDEFGAFTLFPQPNKGVWRMGSVVYRDEIAIYRVVAESTPAARRFIRMLKQWLLKAFRQEEIFIIERDVNLL